MDEIIIKNFETSVQNSPEAEELLGDTTNDIITVVNRNGFIEEFQMLGLTRLLKAKLDGELSIDNFIRQTCTLQLVPYVDLKHLPDYLESIATRYDTYMQLAAGLLYQSVIGIDGFEESAANLYQLNESGLLFVKYGLNFGR